MGGEPGRSSSHGAQTVPSTGAGEELASQGLVWRHSLGTITARVVFCLEDTRVPKNPGWTLLSKH